MAQKFDIIILGGGNAGFGVSSVAAEAGKSIAFVEDWDFGGTCPNRGCTPKKVLVAAANAMHEVQNAAVHGIEVDAARMNWERLIAREKDMISFIPNAMEGVASKRGTVFRGRGRFVGPNSVQVGDEVIEAENIVIATGSTPRPLNFPGAEHLKTSDDVLADTDLPERVVFIGGGVIAMEFAHVYNRAGAEVTILEALPQLLPRMDADMVAAIRAESERLGIVFETGIAVDRIEKDGDALTVHYTVDGEHRSVVADKVVNGTGRIPNVADLALDAADIKHEGLAISVDEYLRSTSNPSIWVVGDALTISPQLSPIATYEGRIVGQNIVNGPSTKPDYATVPSSVYTIPAIATVGPTEAQAKEQGLDVRVSTNDMTGWFSAKSYGEHAAWAKVLVENGTDRIVGAHMVGHHAEDLIHLLAMAMKHGITASGVKDSIFAFPTFSSDIKNLL